MLLKLLQTRKNIRINTRILRKSLTLEKQYNASIKVVEKAFNCNFIVNSKNIAIFLPFDGEINTYPLILKFWARKNKVFLPVIVSFNEKKLLFVRFTQNSILHCNKYKIFEPFFTVKDIISISDLDVVIVPLVAFDKTGVRLGMGGGFYDIFLKNWHENNFIPIGLAYNCQLVDRIPKHFWDISLPTIVTPNKIWNF